PRFFAELDDRVIEVCVQPIHAAGDQGARNNPLAWLLATRPWDQAQLATLAALTGGKVSLEAPSVTLTAPTTLSEIVLLRPLRDWQDHTVRLLRLEYQTPELGRMVESDAGRSAVFVAFGLLVLVAMWLALRAWVLRPLSLVSHSLAQGDAAPVR